MNRDELAGVLILKGTGRINGDGWKDVTVIGETVFVWNAEMQPPYGPGQYPRVGKEHWGASVEQYDFVAATVDDVRAILSALQTESALGGGGRLELHQCYTDEQIAYYWRQETDLARAHIRALEARVASLFDAIKHGDQEHQDWLKKAIEDHFARQALERDDAN